MKKTAGVHEDGKDACVAGVTPGTLGPNISARGPKAPEACLDAFRYLHVCELAARGPKSLRRRRFGRTA